MKKLNSSTDRGIDKEGLESAALCEQSAGEGRIDDMEGVAGLPVPFLPVGLSAEERAEPMRVVVSFFRMYPLPEARERIKAWESAVLSAPSWPVAETGVHLDFYLSVCRLVSCAALLRDYETPLWALHILEGADGGAGKPPEVLYCPRGVTDAEGYYPLHLSRAEWSAPGLALRRLFEGRSPAEWLSELYELFTYSLTDCTPELVDDDCDVAGILEGLCRLVETVHLTGVWYALRKPVR